MGVLVLSLLALFVYASTLFFIALIWKDNGLADVGYGGAFVVAATVALLAAPVLSFGALILFLLLLVWGFRLSFRIYRKNKEKPEDFRYREWRKSWGRWFVVRSFFQIYLLQASIAYVIALPVLLAIVYPLAIVDTAFLLGGLLVWCVGFFFEARGDYELDVFLKDPTNKGKIMTTGLWKYSRHPNYFGESVMWWGMAAMGFGVSSYGVIGFVSPLLITYLLLFVSGIPMLERRFAERPGFEEYKIRTSAFFPLLPRVRK
jgi:steroid 5-alpha reductase family enzyme